MGWEKKRKVTRYSRPLPCSSISHFRQAFRKGLSSQKGQTLVEYGLLTVLTSLVIVAVLALLGDEVQTLMNTIVQRMDEAGII